MTALESSSITVETGRSPVYLSVEKATALLVGANLYSAETLPPADELEEIILAIEDRIDEWVGCRVAPTQYVEDDVTNRKGIAMLNHYPVVSVEEIALYPDHVIPAEPAPIEPSRISGIWRRDRCLYMGSADLLLRVRYTAGIQPIPRTFTTVASAVLLKAMGMSPTGDTSFLEAPFQEREVSSISLPGGLSKSFRTYRPPAPSNSGGTTGSGLDGSVTELDRLLAPLKRYRYRVITAN